jgi:transketolase
MRQKVCDALVKRAENPNMVFLTGDLGFMALEPLQAKLGERFINCGVAEQNMISVAAAMAKEQLDVWIYTIAPFCYARAFEQIRNDVCLHGLPVKMLCNGGGYGYGVMGSTHHALEDYGILATLPGMGIYVPAVHSDIPEIIEQAGWRSGPSYIRLGRDERPADLTVPVYSAWRQLKSGRGPVVITLGPISGLAYDALRATGDSATDDVDAELWIVSELPVLPSTIPEALVRRIVQSGRLCIVEEHVKHGGLGNMICQWVVEAGIQLKRFSHLCAQNRSSPLSGSQDYLRGQSGLSRDAIKAAVHALGRPK